jgi:hypothetical protein
VLTLIICMLLTYIIMVVFSSTFASLGTAEQETTKTTQEDEIDTDSNTNKDVMSSTPEEEIDTTPQINIDFMRAMSNIYRLNLLISFVSLVEQVYTLQLCIQERDSTKCSVIWGTGDATLYIAVVILVIQMLIFHKLVCIKLQHDTLLQTVTSNADINSHTLANAVVTICFLRLFVNLYYEKFFRLCYMEVKIQSSKDIYFSFIMLAIVTQILPAFDVYNRSYQTKSTLFQNLSLGMYFGTFIVTFIVFICTAGDWLLSIFYCLIAIRAYMSMKTMIPTDMIKEHDN